MERLDLGLNEFTRRAASMQVAHSATTLTRGLEPGERILVRDGEEHFVATVRDISFDLTDTHYRLELGAHVAREDVDMLLSESPAAGPTDLGDVLDLLREARQLAARRSYLAGARTR